MQAYNSVMYGDFCVGFIHFLIKGVSLSDYPNLCSPNECEKNDKIIPKYFY